MATTTTDADTGIIGRARRASLSVINTNPQLGIWQAAGTAIAQAPNLTELRDVEFGGNNITFNAQGHSARLAALEEDSGQLALVGLKSKSKTWSGPSGIRSEKTPAVDLRVPLQIDEECVREVPPATDTQLLNGHEKQKQKHHHHHHHHGLFKRHHEGHHVKAKWGPTIMHGLAAFWKFFTTPSGFLITIYCLNIVAWGAMLFFLLLKAAPAMNHPSADDDNSPRKIWIEIDSQILNALFCVTGFGLAPWRFRDLYWFVRAVHFRDTAAMKKLAEQNKSWFRPPAWATQDDETVKATYTGQVAPPTPVWKLGFTIWMMVLNTLLQAVLCFFMWHYNRIDRPSWATGTFIALGCGVAMFAGLMSWWESRKVKKIEGPEVKIVQEQTVL